MFQLNVISLILHQQDSVEAEKVEVIYSKKSASGSVRVDGCTKCPMRMEIDSKTVLLHQGKPVRERQIIFLSGKSGTVIYDHKSQRVHTVDWW